MATSSMGSSCDWSEDDSITSAQSQQLEQETRDSLIPAKDLGEHDSGTKRWSTEYDKYPRFQKFGVHADCQPNLVLQSKYPFNYDSVELNECRCSR
jgi:hypothetical protein